MSDKTSEKNYEIFYRANVLKKFIRVIDDFYNNGKPE
jgi:hypothetical protein